MTKPPHLPPPPLSPTPTDAPILQPASRRRRDSKPSKLFRAFRSAFRSLPIINPACRFHGSVPRATAGAHTDGHIHGAARTTGTLFGHRKSRISIAIQDNSRSIPFLVLELAVPTARFMQDMGTGLLRVALECEKKPGERIRLLEEQLWCAFVNGRRIGYAQRREPNESDLQVLQLLHAVSMGAGVLPLIVSDPNDGELTYMRAYFDRVVGSRDSETFYMLNPDGNSGPELSIFFVRI
ncbi:protein MIZU-KUSSEI 1-like [Phalaenopsis equestris]|uniref:protein MIZU-KUSSEI 1-like n=1 Tax=Phalaenopsis equestris TaxID=78828 RepID=UPI0009E41E94|nr:protein MIZU-KUSSEI 1-like [Phalaenopsis equestris]